MSGPEVYELMMQHHCWEFSDGSPHFKKMDSGDTLIFYLGGQKGRYIAGEACIAGPAAAITENSPVTFDRNKVPYFTWRIPLARIRRYEPKKYGLEVVEQLSFARTTKVERKYIGLLLRNGCRVLTDEDVGLIRSSVARIPS